MENKVSKPIKFVVKSHKLEVLKPPSKVNIESKNQNDVHNSFEGSSSMSNTRINDDEIHKLLEMDGYPIVKTAMKRSHAEDNITESKKIHRDVDGKKNDETYAKDHDRKYPSHSSKGDAKRKKSRYSKSKEREDRESRSNQKYKKSSSSNIYSRKSYVNPIVKAALPDIGMHNSNTGVNRIKQEETVIIEPETQSKLVIRPLPDSNKAPVREEREETKSGQLTISKESHKKSKTEKDRQLKRTSDSSKSNSIVKAALGHFLHGDEGEGIVDNYSNKRAQNVEMVIIEPETNSKLVIRPLHSSDDKNSDRGEIGKLDEEGCFQDNKTKYKNYRTDDRSSRKYNLDEYRGNDEHRISEVASLSSSSLEQKIEQRNPTVSNNGFSTSKHYNKQSDVISHIDKSSHSQETRKNNQRPSQIVAGRFKANEIGGLLTSRLTPFNLSFKITNKIVTKTNVFSVSSYADNEDNNSNEQMENNQRELAFMMPLLHSNSYRVQMVPNKGKTKEKEKPPLSLPNSVSINRRKIAEFSVEKSMNNDQKRSEMRNFEKNKFDESKQTVTILKSAEDDHENKQSNLSIDPISSRLLSKTECKSKSLRQSHKRDERSLSKNNDAHDKKKNESSLKSKKQSSKFKQKKRSRSHSRDDNIQRRRSRSSKHRRTRSSSRHDRRHRSKDKWKSFKSHHHRYRRSSSSSSYSKRSRKSSKKRRHSRHRRKKSERSSERRHINRHDHHRDTLQMGVKESKTIQQSSPSLAKEMVLSPQNAYKNDNNPISSPAERLQISTESIIENLPELPPVTLSSNIQENPTEVIGTSSNSDSVQNNTIDASVIDRIIHEENCQQQQEKSQSPKILATTAASESNKTPSIFIRKFVQNDFPTVPTTSNNNNDSKYRDLELRCKQFIQNSSNNNNNHHPLLSNDSQTHFNSSIMNIPPINSSIPPYQNLNSFNNVPSNFSHINSALYKNHYSPPNVFQPPVSSYYSCYNRPWISQPLHDTCQNRVPTILPLPNKNMFAGYNSSLYSNSLSVMPQENTSLAYQLNNGFPTHNFQSSDNFKPNYLFSNTFQRVPPYNLVSNTSTTNNYNIEQRINDVVSCHFPREIYSQTNTTHYYNRDNLRSILPKNKETYRIEPPSFDDIQQQSHSPNINSCDDENQVFKLPFSSSTDANDVSGTLDDMDDEASNSTKTNNSVKISEALSDKDDLSSCGEFEFQDDEDYDPFDKYPHVERPKYEHIVKTEVHQSAVGKRFEYFYLRSTVCNCIPPDPDEIKQGKSACDENCFNRKLKVECNRNCPVFDICTNRRFQEQLYSLIEPFYVNSDKGWGIRAMNPILAGSFIIEYVGELIDFSEFTNRINLDSSFSNDFIMSIQKDLFIDAGNKGNWSRFVNHSCNPNTTVERWVVNGKTRIGIFAKRAIDKLEEITIDYQYQQYGTMGEKCKCGSDNCTGTIGRLNEKLKDQIQKSESRKRKDLINKITLRNALKETNHVTELITVLKDECLEKETFADLIEVLLNTESDNCIRKFVECGGVNLITIKLDKIGWNDWEFKLLFLRCIQHLKLNKRALVGSGKFVLKLVEHWSGSARYKLISIVEDIEESDECENADEDKDEDGDEDEGSSEGDKNIKFELEESDEPINDVETQIKELALELKISFATEMEKFYIPKVKSSQEFTTDGSLNNLESFSKDSHSRTSSIQGDYVRSKKWKIRRKCNEVIKNIPKEEFRRLFAERHNKSVSETCPVNSEKTSQTNSPVDLNTPEAFQIIKQILSNVIVDEINSLKMSEKFSDMPSEFQNMDLDKIFSELNIIDKDGTLIFDSVGDEIPKSDEISIHLPPNWKYHHTQDGRPYFYHVITKKTQWEEPLYPWDAGDDDPMAYDYNNVGQYQVTLGEIERMYEENRYRYIAIKQEEKRQRRLAKSLQRKLNMSAGEKNKIEFSRQVFRAVKDVMKPYFSSKCQIGRVKTKQDLKFLCEKFAETIIAKESKSVADLEDLELNLNVKSKIRNYIEKSMAKHGKTYRRPKLKACTNKSSKSNRLSDTTVSIGSCSLTSPS